MAASKAPKAANSAKKTKYQKLVSAKKSYCKGKALATTVKAAEKTYIEDAVKKGKPLAEAKAIASRVSKMACNVAAGYISGKKKKTTTTKRKTAVSGVRATVAKVGRPRKTAAKRK